MCGFAGVVSFNAEHRIDDAAALAAGWSADLAHRGPDGEGFFSDESAVLVHRRLAVLDPRPRSDQPFVSDDGRLVLVFNGEIYNFRELRAALPPRAWRTDGDTEVLLAAYEAWGERCVDRLLGMFAFAVLDRRDAGEPRVFLARDRAGQKPLYVAGCQGAVAFASELAPLRRLPWVDQRLNDRALRDYLTWGYVPDPRTIYRGVAKLPPGTVQTLSSRSATSRYYFDAATLHPSSEEDGDARFASPVTRTRDAVMTAVERRLVSDVPVGCLLSGGIDSSVVALCMARLMARDGRRPTTFSIGFDDPRYDESAHARAVARHLGTDHHEFRVTPRVADVLPRLARVFGEPFADSSAVPTHYLSQETRRHVKVALGGDGGDELFGGYDRYRALAVAQRLDKLPAPLRRALAAAAGGVGRGHSKSLRSRAMRFGESLADSPSARYAGYMRLFSPELVDRLLPDAGGPDEAVTLDDYLDDRGVMAAAAALDRATYLPGDLLVKLDRCSMLHALEVRSPFMDSGLLRFASTLADAELRDARGGKKLLRDAFAPDLPAEVFARRKMGFAVPIGDWFRGDLRPMLRDTLLAADSFARSHLNLQVVSELLDAHDAGVDHGQRLYALLMLELWWRDTAGGLLPRRDDRRLRVHRP